MIPKQFIRGHDVNINIHKRFPWAAGYKLQATGGRLQARGNRLQARSNRAARSSGYKPGATSIVFGVCFQDHFGMLAGFRKR